MPAYNPIANSEVDPESPLTSSLMIRMRDNPLAIQEGDPTAPRIQTAAYADASVTLAKLASDVWGFTGTTGELGTLTLPGFTIKYGRFVFPANDTSETIIWDTPFVFGVHFCLAGINRTAAVNQDDGSTIVWVRNHDLTGATLNRNASSDEGHGFVFAVGL